MTTIRTSLVRAVARVVSTQAALTRLAGSIGLVALAAALAPLAAQETAAAASREGIARPVANRAPTGAPAGEPAGTVTERGARGEMSIDREVFSYESSGRRDPFRSLMVSGDLKPLLGDLRLVAIAFDQAGGNSVAILRDLVTKEQYRVRTGTLLGRMRVAHIRSKSVVFTIEELGYSRQETLGLSDTSAERSK
jgi:hypothetical protein